MQLKPEIFRAFLWKLKRLSRGVADTTSNAVTMTRRVNKMSKK